ncbi:hypothetical protein [Streptomyces rochei]|uniref:hypothetical protein n=1 Tax=Streptomyces rochei TaxID=1928 RepID=UPI0036F6DE27
MTIMRSLPHDPYIEAVTDALTAAGLTPVEQWADDGETKGTYCHLTAVLSLDPSGTHDQDDEEVPAGTPWRHGLLLSWEWHTGAEEGWEKGPRWEFAALKADGSCEYTPAMLPVFGYASPAAVVDAVRRVVAREIRPDFSSSFGGIVWDGGVIGDAWERHTELDAACEAWGTEEAGAASTASAVIETKESD